MSFSFLHTEYVRDHLRCKLSGEISYQNYSKHSPQAGREGEDGRGKEGVWDRKEACFSFSIVNAYLTGQEK